MGASHKVVERGGGGIFWERGIDSGVSHIFVEKGGIFLEGYILGGSHILVKKWGIIWERG